MLPVATSDVIREWDLWLFHDAVRDAHYIASNGRKIDKWWIVKNTEGSRYGLSAVMCRHFLRKTKRKHRQPQSH